MRLFENLGSGYIIIGQDCNEHEQPVFPPVGLQDNQLDKVQKELLDYCNSIQPPYFPVLSLEEVEGKSLIVLWAPGGQNRPYKAAKEKNYHYYIRRYSSTVEAKGGDERELLSLTATVLFDDRLCQKADTNEFTSNSMTVSLWPRTFQSP